MNIRDLQYFVAVAQLRHFGRAAKECAVSQPTLSGQLKKLEQTLGVNLFERDRRNVRLTEFGKKVLPIVRELLEREEMIYQMAHLGQDEFKGTFKLGAFPTLASYILPDIVPAFQRYLPDIRLMLVEEKTEDLLHLLESGRLDVALLALPIDTPNLSVRVLFEDPFYLAVPPNHPLAQYDVISQKGLADYPLMLLEEGHCLRDQALDFCKITGSSEYHDFRATSLETLRQMVRAGTGITLMPQIAIEEEPKGVVYIPFKDKPPSRQIALVWRNLYSKRRLLEKVIESLLRSCQNEKIV